MKIYYFLLLLLLVGLSSCRKKIYSGNESIVDPNNNTAYFVKPWRKISFPDFNDVRCFAEFNGDLYVGGGFENSMDYDFLVKVKSLGYDGYTYPDTYTGGFEYIKQVTGDFYDLGNLVGIRSLKVINNRLYIGGKFRYQGNGNWYDLMVLDADGSFHYVDFPHNSFGSETVNYIGEFNNNPLICGNFTKSTQNPVITDYVTSIVNDVAVGMADLNGVTYCSEIYQGELYVVGSQDQIVKWNGTDWTEISYPSKTATDKVYSVKVYNNELYFLGDFTGSSVLKKYSPETGWSDDLSMTSFSVPNFSRLKVYDGKLIIVGKGFKSNNVQGSIWMYGVTNSWQRFGDLTSQVYDVILFDGKYFAAVEDGIYLY